MKKFIAFIMLFFMLPTIDANAAVGDVAGNIYATDIVTYMYYAPITSYNIGGRTCIDAEILNWHYGFDVYWRPESRRLEITDKGGRFVSLQAMSGSIVESEVAQPGRVIGHYYETDIVATLNGREIESYNIGGRTIICAEAMRDFGYNVDWDPEKRTLTISKREDFYSYSTDLGTIRSMDNLKEDKEKLVFLNRDVIVTQSGVQYFLDIPSDRVYCDADGVTYMKLSDLAAVLGGSCKMREDRATAVTEWVNGITDSFDYYTYTFELSYDESTASGLTRLNTDEYREKREEVTGDDCYILDLGGAAFEVNGEQYGIKAAFGGREYDSSFRVIENEVYIPVYTVVRLLGYEYAV